MPGAARHTARVDNDEERAGVAAASATDLPTTKGRRWSFGILVVAALRLVDAAGLLFIGLGQQILPLRGLPILGDPAVTRTLDLILATLTILGVVGLLARQGWGWVLTMVLVGGGLAAELTRYAIGTPDPIGLLILVLSAFYLNQRSVRSVARDVLEDDR